ETKSPNDQDVSKDQAEAVRLAAIAALTGPQSNRDVRWLGTEIKLIQPVEIDLVGGVSPLTRFLAGHVQLTFQHSAQQSTVPEQLDGASEGEQLQIMLTPVFLDGAAPTGDGATPEPSNNFREESQVELQYKVALSA